MVAKMAATMAATMQALDPRAVWGLRMARQRLDRPVEGEAEYMALFRKLQPVKPYAFGMPGNPPTLSHRVDFDEVSFINLCRGDRSIIKGRFGGAVGYILPDELELYAAAYRKSPKLDREAMTILELIEREGPLTPRLIKEMTGILNKRIMPRLQAMQEAYLVYEDQVDGDWERGFYLLSKEFDIDPDRIPRVEAVSALVLRATEMNVLSTREGLKAFTRLPSNDLKAAIQALLDNRRLLEAQVGDRRGFVRAEDMEAIRGTDARPAPGVLDINLSDFLVKMDADLLEARFGGRSALSYVWVDGVFHGVVEGKWRQGPHDVHAVCVDLPQDEAQSRREEILAAVRRSYPHLDTQDYRYEAMQGASLA